MRTAGRWAGSARGDESAVGLLPLVWGVTAALMLMFLAVALALRLYATSVVGAVGHDAARRAAAAGGEPGDLRAARSWLRERLGSATIHDLRVSRDDDMVVVTLTVEPPSGGVTGAGPLGSPISRMFVVPVEDMVEDAR